MANSDMQLDGETKQAALAMSAYNQGKAVATAPAQPVDWGAKQVCDVTLREGQQASGAVFSQSSRMRVYESLMGLGIGQVQCGYPGKYPEDAETARLMRKTGGDVEIEGVASVVHSNWRSEIGVTIASGVDVVHIIYPSSELRLRVMGRSADELVAHVYEAVQFAKAEGAKEITFCPTDTTRTSINVLEAVYRSAVEAGASRVAIADTAGAATPVGIMQIVNAVCQMVDVPVQVHCHNDLGLALANALAALEMGADTVDASVNGLGERAGNVALDELLVALVALGQAIERYELGGLLDLGELVAEVSGTPIYRHKPYLGKDAYAHKLDQHVEALAVDVRVYEPIPPSLVGNRRSICVGLHTGPAIVSYKLEELGLGVVGQGEREALAQRARAQVRILGRDLTDTEFVALATQFTHEG